MAGIVFTAVGNDVNAAVDRVETPRWAYSLTGLANLAGYTGVFQILDKFGGTVLLSGTVANATTEFDCSLTIAQLNTLGAGNFVYQFLVTYPSGDVVRWAKGNFAVS